MSEIVLVSTVCDIWVDGPTARKVAEAMQAGSVFITIKGNMIATNSIKGLMQPAIYKTHCVNTRRNWTCRRGAGHTFNQRCDCKELLPPKDLSQPSLSSENELTPEQQNEANIKAEAMKAWIKHCKPNWKKMADKREREKYVDNFIKNYGKSIDL